MPRFERDRSFDDLRDDDRKIGMEMSKLEKSGDLFEEEFDRISNHYDLVDNSDLPNEDKIRLIKHLRYLLKQLKEGFKNEVEKPLEQYAADRNAVFAEIQSRLEELKKQHDASVKLKTSTETNYEDTIRKSETETEEKMKQYEAWKQASSQELALKLQSLDRQRREIQVKSLKRY